VEHAKQHCRSKPVCAGCPVRSCRHREMRAELERARAFRHNALP
jgi:hypothetical protein